MDSYQTGSFNQSGRYSQFSEISRGGMGIVYRAVDQESQRPVAIKVIQGQNVDMTEIQRFRREADALIQLDHPNILNLIDVQIHDAKLILILEYVDGHDISALHKLGQLQRNSKNDIERISVWFEEIAKGLLNCHETGMIHRDIKPQNILIESETERAVIIDFGIVKTNKGKTGKPSGFTLSLTADEEVLGTPAFMAPELFTGASATAASDVWAFGATLFYAVTGMVPFVGDNPVQVYRRIMEGPPDSIHSFNSRVPDWLEAACLECMTEDPLDRPHIKTIIEQFQTKNAERVGRPMSPLILKSMGGLIVLASVIVAALILLTPDPEPFQSPTVKKEKKKRGRDNTTETASPARRNRDFDLEYFIDEVADSASLTKLPEKDYRSKCKSGVFKSARGEIEVKRSLFDVAGPGVVTRIFLSRRVKSGRLQVFIDRAPIPTFEFQLDDIRRSGYKSISSPWFQTQNERVSIYLPIPFRKRCKIDFVGDAGSKMKTIYHSVDYRKYGQAPIISLNKKILQSCAKKLNQRSAKLKDSIVSPSQTRSILVPKGKTTTLLSLQSTAAEGGQILRQWGLRFLLDESLRKEAYALILIINLDGVERVRVPLLAFLMMNLSDRIDPFKFKIRSRFTQIKQKSDWVLSCWPMAFRDSLSIELENRAKVDFQTDFQYQSEAHRWTENSLYFTAHWRRGDSLKHFAKFGLELKENQGYYAGTYLTVHNPVNLWWSYGAFVINTEEHSLGSPTSNPLYAPFQEYYFGHSFSVRPGSGIRDLHDEKNSYQSHNGVWNGSPVNDNRGRNAITYYRWREFDRVYFRKSLSIDFPASHEFSEMVQGRSMINYFYLKNAGPKSDPGGSTKLPKRQDLFRGAKISGEDVLVEGEEMLAPGPLGSSQAKSMTVFETATTGPFGFIRGVMNWNCFGCLYWNFQLGSKKQVSVFAPVKPGRYKVYFHGFRTKRNQLRITLNGRIIDPKKWTSPAPDAKSFPRVFWGEFQMGEKVTLTIEFTDSNPQSEELYLDYLHFIPVS